MFELQNYPNTIGGTSHKKTSAENIKTWIKYEDLLDLILNTNGLQEYDWTNSSSNNETGRVIEWVRS